MSVKESGFLSVEMDGVRHAIRNQPVTKPWFELADDFNRLGHALMDGHRTPLDDNRKLMASGVFVLVHKSFQAALILAEVGLSGESNTILRRAVEGAIALHALESDPRFVARLMGSYLSNQEKVAQMVTCSSDYRGHLDAEQVGRLQATAQGNDTRSLCSPVGGFRINWEQEAKDHCKDLYDLVYRPLSQHGTHITIGTIHQQFSTDEHGKINAIKLGPDTEGLELTLKFACLILAGAARAFANMFGKQQFGDRLQDLQGRCGRILDSEATVPGPQTPAGM